MTILKRGVCVIRQNVNLIGHATDNLGSLLNIHNVYYCLFYFIDISNHSRHCQSLYEILCWFILPAKMIWLSIKLFVLFCLFVCLAFYFHKLSTRQWSYLTHRWYIFRFYVFSCGKRNPLYQIRPVSFVSIVLYLIQTNKQTKQNK
jgi:hypothetical protein